MRAIIMAGGKGTRLHTITKDIPKPMIPIHGKPILEYQVESLKKSGITNITIVVGHLGSVIYEHFGDGNKFGVMIEYIVEDKPLGTAGALYYIKNLIREDFILILGDLILDVDFNRFMYFHKRTDGTITLYGHPNSHPYDSDIIVVDNENKVIKIESKNVERNFYYHNFVNAGLYCINPRLLDEIESSKKIDLEKDLISGQISKGRVYAYRSTEYVKDMGTPNRLDAVITDISNNVVSSKCLKKKQKAIFLDRDGTMNYHIGFLRNIEDLKLINGVTDAVRKINQSQYLAIVATNQPVIARGELTFQELDEIHKKLETELGKNGVYLDDIFFCPHHPDRGYDGEVPELKINCECRKPKIGMLLQAAEKYNIDLRQSWYIGDTTIDIQTGINAGMKTILVLTGEAGRDEKYSIHPTYTANTLLDAVKYILD